MTPGHGRGCRCCEQTSLYPCPVARDQQGRHPSGRGRRGHGLRLGGCWGPGRASGSARCHRKDSTTSGAFSGLAKSPATMTASPTRPAPGGRPPCEATRDDDGSSGVYEGAPWERPVQGDSHAIGRLMLHRGPLREGMAVVRAHESDAEHRPMGFSASVRRPASAVRSSALNRAAGASMPSRSRMATDHAARASSVVLQGCWGRPVLLAQGRRSCCVLTRGDTRNRGSGPKRAGVAASGSCP